MKSGQLLRDPDGFVFLSGGKARRVRAALASLNVTLAIARSSALQALAMTAEETLVGKLSFGLFWIDEALSGDRSPSPCVFRPGRGSVIFFIKHSHINLDFV